LGSKLKDRCGAEPKAGKELLPFDGPVVVGVGGCEVGWKTNVLGGNLDPDPVEEFPAEFPRLRLGVLLFECPLDLEPGLGGPELDSN
jgi:hypothetical protein